MRFAYDARIHDAVRLAPLRHESAVPGVFWSKYAGLPDTAPVITRRQYTTAPGEIVVADSGEVPEVLTALELQADLSIESEQVAEHAAQQARAAKWIGARYSLLILRLVRTELGGRPVVEHYGHAAPGLTTTKLGAAAMYAYPEHRFQDDTATLRAMGYASAREVGKRIAVHNETSRYPYPLPLNYRYAPAGVRRRN